MKNLRDGIFAGSILILIFFVVGCCSNPKSPPPPKTPAMLELEHTITMCQRMYNHSSKENKCIKMVIQDHLNKQAATADSTITHKGFDRY